MASCNDKADQIPSKNPPNRSLSLTNAEGKKIEDKKHSSAILQGLHQHYKDERFCDVTLVLGEKEIKAHKVVLASSSRYFEAMFSSNFVDGSLQKLEIPVLDGSTGTALIEYAYSGKIEITPGNVVDLLAGANFLQGFEFIEKSCCEFLKQHMGDHNMIEILQIADQFLQSKLKEFAKKQCCMRFSKVAESDAFLNNPFKLMKELMSDDHLVVEKKGIVYLERKQEEYLLERVLDYINHNQEAMPKAVELLECVRLPLLKNKSLQALKSKDALQSADCTALIDKAIQMKKEKKAKSSEEQADLNEWTKPRPCGEYQLWKGRCFAAGEQVKDEAVAFSDKDEIDVEADYVTGMDLWIRKWDGRPVIGGMKIYYSNGKSLMHGDDTAETKEQFRLEPDEKILKLDCQSGWMIDCLTFYTSKERKLGSFGGTGGNFRQECPPHYHGYLVSVSGTVVKSQGSLGITKLQFLWRFFRVHDQNPVPDYIDAVFDDSEDFDYDDFYDEDYEDYDGYDEYDDIYGDYDDYDIEDENFYEHSPYDDWAL